MVKKTKKQEFLWLETFPSQKILTLEEDHEHEGRLPSVMIKLLTSALVFAGATFYIFSIVVQYANILFSTSSVDNDFLYTILQHISLHYNHRAMPLALLIQFKHINSGLKL